MEIPPNLYFDLQLVELGLDQEGDMVTSAVVVPAGAPAKEAKQLSGRDAVALHALDEVLKLSGAVRNNESLPQNRKVVEISKWRDRCRRPPGAARCQRSEPQADAGAAVVCWR